MTQIPYQRSRAEELQKIQLKREVAGTSNLAYTVTCQNILGAEQALTMIFSPEEIVVESTKPGILAPSATSTVSGG